jgi:hypothetical protein
MPRWPEFPRGPFRAPPPFPPWPSRQSDETRTPNFDHRRDCRELPRSRDLRLQRHHAKNPEAVRGFLKGWFETIADERAHRDETIAYALTAMKRSLAVETKEYDLVMPMFSSDGKFPVSGLKVLARSFVDLGQLDSEPPLTKYYTEKFLPKM